MSELSKQCLHCGSRQLFTRRVDAGGGYGPNLLQGLGGFLRFPKFDVVMCGDCGRCEFFADEEATERAALERARIFADPSLDVAERERRSAALEDGLPEPVRAARAEALAPLRAMQEEARMRAGGTSSVEIRALRERSFGTEAADRLEELDRQLAAGQQRIDDYSAAH